MKNKNGIGWEIAAYTVRGVSVAIPACVTMAIENSWVKTGIGFLAMLLIVALFIIYKEPIKKASGYMPGVIPFSIFVIIALFFKTTSQALLTIGISGLTGSVIAIPLHAKYSLSKNADSEELHILRNIVDKLK